MDKLNVLLVGMGTRGRHWARVIAEHPRAHLLAAADPSPQAVTTFKEQLPQFSVPVMSFEDALALHPDVVVLSTPPDVHLEQISACAERRIPVLCEKPLALDARTARACVDAAQSAGSLLGVGMNFRYLETTRRSREYIQGGKLGQVGFGRIVYWRYRNGRRPLLNKYPLTMDQPMLLEQSIHHLDLARFIYGSEVKRVWARTTNPPWSMYRSDATVAAWLEFKAAWPSSISAPGPAPTPKMNFSGAPTALKACCCKTTFSKTSSTGKREPASQRPLPWSRRRISSTTRAACWTTF